MAVQLRNGKKQGQLEHATVRRAASAVSKISEMKLNISGVEELQEVFDTLLPILEGSRICQRLPKA